MCTGGYFIINEETFRCDETRWRQCCRILTCFFHYFFLSITFTRINNILVNTQRGLLAKEIFTRSVLGFYAGPLVERDSRRKSRRCCGADKAKSPVTVFAFQREPITVLRYARATNKYFIIIKGQKVFFLSIKRSFEKIKFN